MRVRWLPLAVAAFIVLLAPLPAAGQATGSITGRVTRQGVDQGLAGVDVAIQGTGLRAVTGTDGRYTLERVPAGTHVVMFRLLGYVPSERTVTVQAGAAATVDVEMLSTPVRLGEIVVEGASRAPERVVEAPAAVTSIPPAEVRDVALTGQAPEALRKVPGVDIVQSGVFDFNVNARGFNSTLNRRVLVLQDGRDLAIAFLGSQEWSALSLPPDGFGSIEMVRGPGSALYGANAFAGVLNLSTPTAREAVGTRIRLGGGELTTLRADLQHAGVAGEGRFGYRINGGYYQSDSWTQARTAGDGQSLAREYAEATDSAVGSAIEAIPLSGQSLDPGTRAAVGEPDPLRNMYGSTRLDYYAPGGGVLTLDGGAAHVENETFVTGIGRVQVTKAIRPWARLNWGTPNYTLMAWYSGRNSIDPQFSLASGAPLEESSAIVHAEGQYHASFLDQQWRVVVGASARRYMVNTDNTLMAPANDDRDDGYYSGYGQVEYRPITQLRLVAAGRVDAGDLFDTQFSPKGAVVFSPTPEHSIRVTANRAFQTPNYSEFFLRAAAGQPADLTALETGLRASALGAVLAGVPNGQLFTNSAAVPVLALGNDSLDVETVNSFEIGYKGQIGERVFVTVDGYYSELENFVTDLLPGVNPTYAPWTAPDAVPAPFRDTLAVIVRSQLAAAGQPLAAAGLTRLQDGSSAIVVSYTNAGRVTEQGVEIGLSVAATDEIRFDGSYAYFDFEVKEQQLGDVLLPNTPEHRGTIGASYRGRQGLDVSVDARFLSGFRWAAGVFQGWVPASQTVNAAVGYAVNNNLRVHVTGTNILDQQRFHQYGGSVIGRRVLGGVSATF